MGCGVGYGDVGASPGKFCRCEHDMFGHVIRHVNKFQHQLSEVNGPQEEDW